jgi:hypothetical protein
MFGWICPRCLSVYSPFVSACGICLGHAPVVIAPSSTTDYGCTCWSPAGCQMHPWTTPKTVQSGVTS